MKRNNAKPGLIGIDFGTHSVKLAQVVSTANQLKIKAAVVVPRNVVWPNELLSRQSAISSESELNVALEACRSFRGTKAASTISMAVCDVRRMPIPASAANSIKPFIGSQLSTIDRFKGSARQFDFWETERAYSDSGLAANVVSLPEIWTHRCLSDLNSTGLSCKVLDGVPFCLARAFSLFEPSPEPVALLDWGYTRATLCIIQNGYPKFVRILRESGFRNVIDEISNGFQVDRHQAQQVVTDYGLEEMYDQDWRRNVQDTEYETRAIQQSIHDLILKPIDGISKEITRTLNYLENQHRSLQPQKLVLFGGGGALKNIIPMLESKIRMKTEVWGQQTPICAPGRIPLAVLANAIAMSALPFSSSPVDSKQPSAQIGDQREKVN